MRSSQKVKRSRQVIQLTKKTTITKQISSNPKNLIWVDFGFRPINLLEALNLNVIVDVGALRSPRTAYKYSVTNSIHLSSKKDDFQ